MAKKKVNSTIDTIKEATEELLKLTGIDSEIEVSEDIENDSYIVAIGENEATGLLIGNRGRTINSIQMIVGMIVRQRLGDWKRVLVNVADWREKEKEKLEEIATSAALRAKETGEAQPIYNLTPAQRRIVHMILVEDKEVKTESEGEGRQRYLIVSPSK